MLPTFVIFARESLEGSMIVAILLSYLAKIGEKTMRRQIWIGVTVAVAFDFVLGAAIFFTVHRYAGTRLQTILEGTTYFVAAILLIAMSFWMKSQGRGLKPQIERRMQLALTSRNSAAGLALLAAVTVGREGLETVVFMLAIAFHARLSSLIFGALSGLILGLGISYWIYHLGRRIKLGTFFHVFGILLLVFGAALFGDGIENYQSLGWIPWRYPALWQSAHLLSEQSAAGDLLHTFVGYSAAPSLLQMAAYTILLTLVLYLYLRHPQAKSPRQQP